MLVCSTAFLLYIIIRPIAVDEKVPDHDNSNGKGKCGVFGEQFRRVMRNMDDSLKSSRHRRFDVVKDWNAEGNAHRIDKKEHAKLVKKMPRS